MPYNNPFDREQVSPRRRFLSNLSFWASVVFVLAFVVWMFVRLPATVRTDFSHLEQPLSFQETENEFVALEGVLGTSSQGWGPDFTVNYPITAALLSMDESVWQENTPYVLEAGQTMAVALAYHDTADQSIVKLDVLLLPYAMQQWEDGTNALTLSAPHRYTVTYGSGTGVVALDRFRTSDFRLNFYTLSFHFAAASDVEYTVDFAGVISDKQAETYGLFQDITVTPAGGTETLERREAENATRLSGRISGVGTDSVSLEIAFGDEWYDSFQSISLYAADLDQVTLGIN